MLQTGGGRVVFSSNRDGNTQVYSMNTDGNGQVRITSGVYQETAIGYDGYGRLQSRHALIQDAGKNTTYSYNPDDTLATVTDARGR